MRHGVAQGAIRSDVDLLATRNNDAEGEGLVTTSEDSVVAGRTGGANVGRAVAGRCSSAEVELSAASSQRQKVDGRGTAGRDDSEVAGTGSGCRRRGRRGRSIALSSSESTSDETCECESVLHCDRLR